jgi:hypothetical protein
MGVLVGDGSSDTCQWIPLVKDSPFTATTAERLMAIGRNSNIANRAHAQHLPPSWTTLYEPTELPDEVLEQKIVQGTINPRWNVSI